jgi:RES domain-containing protein
MKPHPAFARLAAALSRVPPRAFSGVTFRSASPAHAASRELLSGEGVRRHGGRWNPPGAFTAIYASLTPETAIAEALSHFRHYGIPDADAMPRVLVALEVKLESVADLADGRARRILRISRRRMRGEPWRALQGKGREALTQSIGRAAFEAGLEGLLVPSAATRNGTNVVVFPEHLRSGSRLLVRSAAPGASTYACKSA